MKTNLIFLLTLIIIVLISCDSKNESGSKTNTKTVEEKNSDSLPEKTTSKVLMKGSVRPKSNVCGDTCVLIYDEFAIITEANKDNPGEKIYLMKDELLLQIKAEEPAIYFAGVIGKFILLDAGTSVLRQCYIYDSEEEYIIATIDNVIENPVYENGNLECRIYVTTERADSLHLKPCPETGTELSGYTEKLIYNLDTRELKFMGDYKCLE